MIAIKPKGHYVLIELMEVKNVSTGGIVLGDTKRESAAIQFGVIKAFGPTAFVGVAGCDPKDYPPGDPRYNMEPHQLWGVEIGDRVEFKRYEGTDTSLKSAGSLRYVPDTTLIGGVAGNFEITKADF